MKCPKCQGPITGNMCGDCGHQLVKKGYYTEQMCSVCNNARGKGKTFKINVGSRDQKEICICFQCHQDQSTKRFNYSSKSYELKEEADYQRGLVTYFLMPKFYDQEPNWKEIDKLGRNLLQAQIEKSKTDILKSKNDAVYHDKDFKQIGDLCNVN